MRVSTVLFSTLALLDKEVDSMRQIRANPPQSLCRILGLNLEIDERKNQAPSRVRDTERWSSFFCSTKTTTSLRRRSFLFRSRQAQLHGSSVERMSNPQNNLITHFANQEVLNETLGSRIFASSVTTKTETVLKRRKTRNGEEPSDIHVSRSVEYGYSKTTKR